MASVLHFIVVLCWTSGLWIGANAVDSDCCDPCKTCPSGWTQFKDHCYLYVHVEKDWADAESACIALSGNLASVPDKAVYDFIKQTIFTATNKNGETWVGGHDTAKEGVWLWTDGTKFDLKQWGPGEPNNANNLEHCLEMNYIGAPNDITCTIKRPYICGRRL